MLATSSLTGSVAQLAFNSNAHAAAPEINGFNDYRALVCIMLHGGNDSMNMFIPTAENIHTGYQAYAQIRGDLAVANVDLGLSSICDGSDLNHGNLGKGSANPYYDKGNQSNAYTRGLYDLSAQGIPLGVNGVMPELAQLITDNKASIIANVGNLVEIVSREQIQDESARLPFFLFAHNHQRREMETGQADNLTDIGWAGKIADHWQGINENSPLGLNIAYHVNSRMLTGFKTTPLVLGTNETPNYKGMVLGSTSNRDRRAIQKALSGQQNISGSGKIRFDQNNTFITNDPFQKLYNRIQKKSIDIFDLLHEVLKNNQIKYQSTDSYGLPLFSKLKSRDLGFSDSRNSLIKQLREVAKMIQLGASNKFNRGRYNRQIFFVQAEGYDTHSGQADLHPLLLRELSLALWKFQKAMEEKQLVNQVITFTMSDFGRTMKNNGNGTDHGWGASHIVLGGDGKALAGNLRGGQLFGQLPDVTLRGSDDYSSKGRIIPGIAQDQLNATLCHWFGLDQKKIAQIFPNLSNFELKAGDISSSFIQNLFASF